VFVIIATASLLRNFSSAVARTFDSTKRSRLELLGCSVKLWAVLFPLHCSSSLICINEYLAIDIGVYLCTNSVRGVIAEMVF